MGTKAIDPQSIRNVTIIGDPRETTALIRRLLPRAARADAVHRVTDRVEHTIRIAELAGPAPIAELERSIRVADGVIAVVNATTRSPRLETLLRVADDYQVARMCLVSGLDRPAADFDRCVREIADTRGAVPLPLQVPHGIGPEFEGVIDLVSMWPLAPLAAEFYGAHWRVAEQRYRDLVATVTDRDPGDELPPEQLRHRIRRHTRIGEIVPVLCAAAEIGPLLDAIVRYLPSPLDVCQPEHALDY
ncbi:GTP-binding protein [Nocardia inohanensis]|uniref:GTP-binding protein n=1 Tax=Nocardia inohanensis TaxID=209246 RepID=UPI000835DFE6|nr:GTP-binding protein [Nocardia inohanensis]